MSIIPPNFAIFYKTTPLAIRYNAIIFFRKAWVVQN